MDPQVETAVADLQSRQHGVIARWQAIGARMTPGSIDYRVRKRRWVPMYAGVYTGRGTPATDRTRMWAAWLACGPDAVIAGRTAAQLYRFGIPDGPHPQIIVPPQRAVRRPGIDVSRRLLHVGDVATVDGIRATSPATTIVHLAGIVEGSLLAVALDTGLREGFLTPDRIERRLHAHPSAPGVGLLREMLAIRGLRPVGSPPASEFLECLRRVGLPPPLPEYPVWTASGEKYIDFAYPDEMLALEVDSIKFHILDPDGHRRERARQNELEELGWTFRRFEPRGIRLDPLGTALTVAKALGLEPSRWRAGLTSARSRTLSRNGDRPRRRRPPARPNRR